MLVEDPVKRVDNMTMAWGLEARVPFLDHELVELAVRLPGRAQGRPAAARASSRTSPGRCCPHEVIDRPKGYFPVPPLVHLEGAVRRPAPRRPDAAPAAKERGLFRPEHVEHLLDHPTELTTPPVQPALGARDCSSCGSSRTDIDR